MSRLMILPVDGLPLGKRWLTLGDQGEDVRKLQGLLTGLGLYDGERSGEYDYLTREAVKAFQRAYRLSVDGICGPDTCKLLAEAKINNRILQEVEAKETLAALAAKYGVGLSALKDPETRKRLRRVTDGQQILVEKRELIYGAPVQDSTKLSEKYLAGPGEDYPLYVLTPEEFKTVKTKAFPQASGFVLDLREQPRFKGGGKFWQRLRRQFKTELFWWVKAKHHHFPTAEEADAVVVSVPVFVASTYSHAVWQREIKKILTYYPCTRLFLHFDLRGKEKKQDGSEHYLTPLESKMVRLNRLGDPKRVGEYGWIYYRYKVKEEEREVLLADDLTIRGILNQIDAFNLRGAVLTGLDDWQAVLEKEANRYFLATPRILVMKNEALA